MAKGPKGQRHLCAGCGEWHEPHAPDNCILVPVCPKCWQQCSINTRVWAISLAKIHSDIGMLNNSIHDGIDGAIQDIVQAKIDKMNEYGGN